jgi:hypothetical protein
MCEKLPAYWRKLLGESEAQFCETQPLHVELPKSLCRRTSGSDQFYLSGAISGQQGTIAQLRWSCACGARSVLGGLSLILL